MDVWWNVCADFSYKSYENAFSIAGDNLQAQKSTLYIISMWDIDPKVIMHCYSPPNPLPCWIWMPCGPQVDQNPGIRLSWMGDSPGCVACRPGSHKNSFGIKTPCLPFGLLLSLFIFPFALLHQDDNRVFSLSRHHFISLGSVQLCAVTVTMNNIVFVSIFLKISYSVFYNTPCVASHGMQ